MTNTFKNKQEALKQCARQIYDRAKQIIWLRKQDLLSWKPTHNVKVQATCGVLVGQDKSEDKVND